MRSSRLVRSASALLVAGALAFSAGPAAASSTTAFSQVVVFGDSLSDNGNFYSLTAGLLGPANALPQAANYYQGRFSNGPVAVERLAQGLGVGLVDYAYGGATTGMASGPQPNLPVATGVLAQVAQFQAQLAGGPASATALYIVWAGANDIEYLGATPAVVQQAITNLVTSVATLRALGARNFLLPNLPDVGLTPEALALDLVQPGTSAALSGLSDAFNLGLHASYAAFAAQVGDVSLREVDVAQIQRNVAANPAAFGFSNMTTPCFSGYVGEAGTQCANAAGVFFWDRVHPSAQAHDVLGAQFLAAAVPEPASWGLMAAGLLALGARRHARVRR